MKFCVALKNLVMVPKLVRMRLIKMRHLIPVAAPLLIPAIVPMRKMMIVYSFSPDDL